MRKMLSGSMRRERPVGKSVDEFETRNEKIFSEPMRRERPVGKIADVFELPNGKNVVWAYINLKHAVRKCFLGLCEEKDLSVKPLIN